MSPIRPENRHRYGADWPEFSRSIRFERAAGRCECDGECGRMTHDGRCPNLHGGPAYGTGSTVVLTVAHLCHTPECREHIKAMCQGCHLHYDREHHAETRARTRATEAEEAGQGQLFTPAELANINKVLGQLHAAYAGLGRAVQHVAQLTQDDFEEWS